MLSSLLVLSLLGSASALIVSPARPRVALVRARATFVQMGLEEVAANCLEEGCPIDLVEDLIAELKVTPTTEAGVDSQSIIDQLQTLLASPETNRSEIEKIVAAMRLTPLVTEPVHLSVPAILCALYL